LQQRVEQNYADFEAEALNLLGHGEIYDKAHRIAAVKDAYAQLTSDTLCLDEGEIAFLLNFHNPLEMVADFLQAEQADCPYQFGEALNELFAAENQEDYYLTVDFANTLIAKYGEDVRIRVALLLETIEAGDNYLRLLKLTNKADADEDCDFSDLATPFKPMDFDEDGFFIYEDDEEVCF